MQLHVSALCVGHHQVVVFVVFYDYVCIEIYTHYNLILLTSHNGDVTP